MALKLPQYLEHLRTDFEKLIAEGAPEKDLQEFVSAVPEEMMHEPNVMLDIATTTKNLHDKSWARAHSKPVQRLNVTQTTSWEVYALKLLPAGRSAINLVETAAPTLEQSGVFAIGVGPSVSVNVGPEAFGIGGGVAIGFGPISFGLFGGIAWSEVISWIVSGKFHGLFVGLAASIDLCVYLMGGIDKFGGTGTAAGGDLFYEVGGGVLVLFDDDMNWIGVEFFGGIGIGAGAGILKTYGGIVHT